MDIPKVIPTEYRGDLFRSRLEAKWAVLFFNIKLKYTYEPEGYILPDGQWYLPDFWFPDLNCFGEVKPTTFSFDEFSKCFNLTKHCLLLDTDCPTMKKGFYVPRLYDQRLRVDEDYQNYLGGNSYYRAVLDHSVYKKRLWCMFGEEITDYWIDNEPELIARQYRFGKGGRG